MAFVMSVARVYIIKYGFQWLDESYCGISVVFLA